MIGGSLILDLASFLHAAAGLTVRDSAALLTEDDALSSAALISCFLSGALLLTLRKFSASRADAFLYEKQADVIIAESGMLRELVRKSSGLRLGSVRLCCVMCGEDETGEIREILGGSASGISLYSGVMTGSRTHRITSSAMTRCARCRTPLCRTDPARDRFLS